MKFNYLFFIFLISQLVCAQHSDFSGSYNGNFEHGKFKTDIAFDILSNKDSYSITFNSLSQNAFGIPAGDVKIFGDTIFFALQSDFYRYDFSLYRFRQDHIKGTLAIDGHQYGIDLFKKKTENVNSGIQSKDIRFRSGALLLYGTIYYPEKSNGKAIYILTSSGDRDRSGSRAEALLFSKAGYVSFHIDKRGTGISDGNWHSADIPELCEDDLHALEFLHQTEKMDYAHIGIKGSSQGAAKVPYILQKKPDLAFGIIVSCPASTLLESDLNYWKNRNQEVIKSTDISEASKLQEAVFQYIAEDITRESVEKKIEENKSKSWFNNVWIPPLDQVEFDRKLNYSPLPYFEHNASPMLVIQGSKDEIIQKNSLELIEKTIGKKGNRKNQYTKLKGANHSMMQVENSEFPYWQSLHPDYLSTVVDWIKKL